LVSGPTFTLEDITNVRSWDYGQATLVSPRRFTERKRMSTENFVDDFLKKFPILQDFNWANVAIRGGAVVDILLGRSPSDLDFFLFGLDTHEAFVRRANDLVGWFLQVEKKYVEDQIKKDQEMRKAYKEKNGSEYPSYPFVPPSISIKAVRRGPVVTLFTSRLSVPVQIVLTAYKSIEDVVYGADIAVCGTTFDGERVLFSEEGKFGIENLTIRVPNDQFPRAARLERYFEKGFDIVLPLLDVSKLPSRLLKFGLVDVFETPCITISYSSVYKNKVSVSSFHNVEALPPKAGPVPVDDDDDNGDGDDGLLGGYESGGHHASGRHGAFASALAPDEHSILYDNITALVRATVQPEGADVGDINFTLYGEGDFVQSCLSAWPSLTSRQVENVLSSISAKLVEGEKLDFSLFDTYVKTTPIKKVLLDVASSDKDVVVATKAACSSAIEVQKKACNDLLPAIVAFYKDRLPKVLSSDETFKHKLVTDPALFYGEFRKAL
jgi:hypothetical protein